MKGAEAAPGSRAGGEPGEPSGTGSGALGAGGSGGPLLFARGLNWLGDAVVSLPALLAARLGWEGEILLAARGAGAALYRLSRMAEVAEDSRGLLNRMRLARDLRRRRVAKALLWQNAFGAALTAWLAGAPERVGWNRHGRRALLTIPVDPAPEDLAAHEVFYHLKLVREAGMEAPFSLPRMPAPDPAASPSGLFPLVPPPPGRGGGAGDGSFLLALAPGASFGGAKRWPARNFAAAAALILEGRRGGRAVILGGTGEMGAARETEMLLSGGPPCRNLAGLTGLGECAAVLAASDLALTNDSGLMHLACALGTPTVTPFGPTDPVTTGPLGARSAVIRTPAACSPCLKRECPLKERICFEGATPRAAAEAADRLLAPPPPFPGIGDPGTPAVFSSSLPEDGTFDSPEGMGIVFVLPGRHASDPRLGPPELAEPFLPGSPGSPRARQTPAGASGARRRPPSSTPPAPAASFGGRPVFILPEVRTGRLLREMARDLGADPRRSVWLSSDPETLGTAGLLGCRSGLWLRRGRGLPEGLLGGAALPDLCAPDFQRALDWAGTVK
ncbi:MAG: lipopolysaccharide heptosyltransferase II [Deltaproteobacteria bacterium]|nr:lipopolysaccharide heptosyltransferase II [Deltaproteobacteria bacterium]